MTSSLLTPAEQQAFINEIHYDNTGTDAGEAIEIAGPQGTDLAGYSLVLYNGLGGAVYNTDVLSGVIPDQDEGFGTLTLSYPSNGLQNGSPGIASRPRCCRSERMRSSIPALIRRSSTL